MARKKAAPPVPVAPPLDTGATMMALRQAIGVYFGAPWMAIVRLAVVDDEKPDAPFKVFVRTPTGSEWLGQYPPGLSANELTAIVLEIAQMRETALAAIPTETDDDGTIIAQVNEGVVGKLVTVPTATGPIQVIARAHVPAETEQQEKDRLRTEIHDGAHVTFFAVREMDVVWNEVWWHITAGENTLPHQVKYLYDLKMADDRAISGQLNHFTSYGTVSRGNVSLPPVPA